MINLAELRIRYWVNYFTETYCRQYDSLSSGYVDVMESAARTALQYIASSDALYHNFEHTIFVTLVGQEILQGKQLLEGGVSPSDWLHFIISLLCHDVGYVRGVCLSDQSADRLYATGIGDRTIALPLGATDASLTPYHVDRGKLFVEETFTEHPLIDIELIKSNIEMTRFPVPLLPKYQDTASYPGLARAADLVGQLSDPHYLQKIPALFYEFEETGVNQNLGYRNPDDMRQGYPDFYRNVVAPYIPDALRYLRETSTGRQSIFNLDANVQAVRRDVLVAS